MGNLKDTIILGTGPSLTRSDVELCRDSGHTVIAVNDAYALAPWADILWAGDKKWWQWHYDDISHAFKGRMLTIGKGVEYAGVEFVPSKAGMFLNFDPERPIRQGYNSCFAAMNWAILQGARRIVFLGLDCKVNKNQSHYFGDHPDGKRSPYHLFIKAFEEAAKQLVDTDIEVINASPDSAVTCFRQMTIRQALNASTTATQTG